MDKTTQIALTNDLAELARLSSDVAAFGATHDLSAEVMMAIELSLEEVVTNVIDHGHDGGNGQIDVELAIEGGAVRATVTDGGREYNPLLRPDPDVTAPLEDRRVGGLGVLLVKQLMDEVTYARDNGRNVLTVRKRL
jgi:serine/threonine-protein kinase RsbW